MSNDTRQCEEFSDYIDSLGLSMDEDDKPEVLLLTCIDYRFFGQINKLIERKGLVGQFDHVILAGAELGPVIDFPNEAGPRLHWQQFFLDHLGVAITLHQIKHVIVLGHRQCGAYQVFEVLGDSPSPELEAEKHRFHAGRLKALINRFHEELTFAAFLLPVEPSSDDSCQVERLV